MIDRVWTKRRPNKKAIFQWNDATAYENKPDLIINLNFFQNNNKKIVLNWTSC